ncbi:MAG: 3'-5' exonuclease, partial [Bacillota bacterium]
EPVECGDSSRFAREAEKEASPVHLLHLYNEGDKLRAATLRQGLAVFIAQEIRWLTGKKAPLVTGSEKKEATPVTLSDIYILTRTAREGEQVGKVLQAYGIPHAYYKQEGLFQTEEASNVYRLLCAIDAPNDPASKMSAWLTPFFEVPLADLPAWRDAGGSHPLTGMLLEWKSLADSHAWSKLFEQILTVSGIMRRLVFSRNERALTNYLHLLEILQAEAHARPVTLSELTRSLKARIDRKKAPEGREGNVQRLETDKDAVQILTMHKAKGLEAEVIFIAGGFSDGGGKDQTKIYHKDNRRHLHIGKETGEIKAAVDKEIEEENQRLMYVAITRAKARLYLPYFGEAPADGPPGRSYGYKSLSGFYKNLQAQLDLLAKKGSLEDQRKFLTRPVSCATGKLYGRKKTEEQPESLSEENLIKLMEEVPTSAPLANKITPYHRGVLLTSYTRMKQGAYLQTGTANEEERNLIRNEEVAGETHPGSLLLSSERNGKTAGRKPRLEQADHDTGRPEALQDKKIRSRPEKEAELEESPETTTLSVLPGGRETGIFLHALLESTLAEEVRDRNFKEWSESATVRQRAATLAREHGFGEEHLQPALKLTYKALLTPLHKQSLENGAELNMPGGIAAGENHQAEMSFVYPIPEAFHSLLDENESGGKENDGGTHPPFRAVRGYLQGLIDLVFEHNQQFYLLDWKSDCLDSYHQTALKEHVRNNYHLQAEIYTLALIRQLGIKNLKDYQARFGGVIYIFLRGIKEGGDTDSKAQEGVWFARPEWKEITAKEKEMLQRRQWGGEVIATGNSHRYNNSASKDKGGADDERN